MLKTLCCISLALFGVLGSSPCWAVDDNNRGTPVTVTTVTLDTVIITEEAMGWFEAKINLEIATEVSGRIQRRHVDTGQMVKVGTPMPTIDREPLTLEKADIKIELTT